MNEAIATNTTQKTLVDHVDDMETAARKLFGAGQLIRHLAACPDDIEPECMIILADAIGETRAVYLEAAKYLYGMREDGGAEVAQLNAEIADLKAKLDNSPESNLKQLKAYSQLLAAAAKVTTDEVARVERGEPRPSALSILQDVASLEQMAARRVPKEEAV